MTASPATPTTSPPLSAATEVETGDAATAASMEKTRSAGSASIALDALRARVLAHWPRYLVGAGLLLYLLVFARGLAWQWQSVLFGARVAPPVVASAPPAPRVETNRPPEAPGAVAQPRAKVPLPPSNEPPPRNVTDQYGVLYDAEGVAVMGIDTDPGGVYNVPPGRQVRIGGPQGALFDVQPGGKLTPATRVKEWPK